MTGRAALVRLAGLVGIETRYTDALGQTREASDETLLALIGAFGLPSNPVKAAAELEERESNAPLWGSPRRTLSISKRPARSWRCGCRLVAVRSLGPAVSKAAKSAAARQP